MKTIVKNSKTLSLLFLIYVVPVSQMLASKPWKDRVVDSLQQFVLPSSYLYGGNEWSIGDGMADYAELGGADRNDNEAMQQMCAFNIMPGMRPVFTYYRWNYFGIGLCNQYLKFFSSIAAPSASDNIQKGEVLFIRALLYFNLVRLYGDVPIFTESDLSGTDSLQSTKIVPLFLPTIMSDTLHKARNASSEVWSRIESDLTNALSILPDKSAMSEFLFHIQKGAAQAMMVKAKIYQQQWAEALTYAEGLINSGEYSLEPNFKNCFSVNTKYGAESVFELAQPSINAYGTDVLGGSGPDLGDYWISTNQNPCYNPRKLSIGSKTDASVRGFGDGSPGYYPYYGWGFNCPTPEYVNSFATGDPRLKMTIAAQYDSIVWYTNDFTHDTTWAWLLPEGAFGDTLSLSPTGYYPLKYVVTNNDWKNNWYVFNALVQHSGGIKNIRIIRYADILLYASEAALHTGDSIKALNYINQVRIRARNSGSTSVPADLTSISMDDIYNERAWEFGSEANRYFDLIRTRKAFEMLDGTHINMLDTIRHFDTTKNYLFPIPIQDLAINQGILTQNPGYETANSIGDVIINPEFAHDTIYKYITSDQFSYLSFNMAIPWNKYFTMDSLFKIFVTPKLSVSGINCNISSFHTEYPELNSWYTDYIYNSTISYQCVSEDSTGFTQLPYTAKIVLGVGNYVNVFYDTITIIIDTYPTEITDLKESANFKIFPNPSRDILNIQLGVSQGIPTRVEIITMAGQIVYSNTIKSDATIDIAGLQKGACIVKITGANGKTMAKTIIIE